MDIAEMTFGIEIETCIPAGAIMVGTYTTGVPAQGLPEGWVAKYDGSIRPFPGHVGCEFVSPVLRGPEGLRSVIAAVAAIRAMGGRVNASTGLHIHVGFDRSNAAALTRLVTLTSNFEKAIYASTGTKTRENGTYCRPVSHLGDAQTTMSNGRCDRYRVLNLRNLLTGGKPTVEFRAFAGSLNTDKIVGYIRLCLGLVERACKAKRVTNWTAKAPVESSPVHRNGEGQTALARLFYQLGWTKGRAPVTYGDLQCESAPDIARNKETLMRLAAKYDAQ